jgi:hypothetical protein
MGRISWTDRVKNGGLQRVKGNINTLYEIKRRETNWIGQILRRNCLLKHVIEGKIEGRIEVRRRQGRRHRQTLYDLKEKRGNWKLKEGILYRSFWRKNRFGRGCGPVATQTP